MPNEKTPIDKVLLRVREEKNGDITFNFADGSTQRQPLNDQIFYDEKGKLLEIYKVVQLLNDLCHDKHATGYVVE